MCRRVERTGAEARTYREEVLRPRVDLKVRVVVPGDFLPADALLAAAHGEAAASSSAARHDAQSGAWSWARGSYRGTLEYVNFEARNGGGSFWQYPVLYRLFVIDRSSANSGGLSFMFVPDINRSRRRPGGAAAVVQIVRSTLQSSLRNTPPTGLAICGKAILSVCGALKH